MKKLLLVVLCLALFVPIMLFAAGEGKDEKTKIILVHGYADYYQKWLDEFAAENPEAEVAWVPKGSGVVAVDALIAAKEKPHVFMSTPGDVGRFMIPGFALDLSEYLDLSDFKAGSLDIYTRGNEVLGLPVTVAVNAFNLNLTLAESVGIDTSKYLDRDFLSIDEFVQFCEAIKRNAPEGYYGTAIWAGNAGSQGVQWHWLSAFGARFYDDGDYSHTILNSPEAAKGLNFMKMLVDEGYAPPEASVLDDDEGIAMWASGKIGGLWARAGGWLGMIDNAVKQGMLDERFESMFMTWPVADGVDGNPLSYGGAAGIVLKHDSEEENILAAKLLDKMTSAGAQSRTIAPGAGYVTRYSALEPPQEPWPEWVNVMQEAYEKAKKFDEGFVKYTKISELFAKYGGLDTGASTLYNKAMTQEWLKVFQPFMTGDISAEEALATFEREFNKVLAGE